MRTSSRSPSAVLWQVDAFADRPFTGNPAAVCLLPAPRDEAWMQAVAAEMNLSETAFVTASPDELRVFSLRWFTPATEVELCGHATLAAAWTLWESGVLPAGEPARFDTASGRLTVEQRPDGWLEMDFPATPPEPWSDAPRAAVAAALGLGEDDLVGLHRSRFDLVVEVGSARTVRRLAPRLDLVAGLPARGVIVTARGDGPGDGDGADFVSRFFGPAVGVPEDPVTGSAHCALAPFWAARLGKDEMTGYQASRRGGTVRVRLAPDGRVRLAGRAVTVLMGEIAT